MVFVVTLEREPFPKKGGGGKGVGFLSKFLEMGDAVALLLMRWTMDQKVWVQRPWGGQHVLSLSGIQYSHSVLFAQCDK